jgi:hypothetical protein
MRTALLLAASTAICALLSCGEEKLLSCTADAFCRDGLVCHPLAKVCVPKCTTSSDCPTSSKECAEFAVDAGAPPRFCQCQSTALCGSPESVVCGGEEKICMPRCHNDVDCTFGRRCDADTGTCLRR